MNIIKSQKLACPIDGKSLEQADRQFVCENGHTYDIARQGYVNLLPVQYKRSKQPGDSKAMVIARSLFLETGIYRAIATKLNDTVWAQIINHKDVCILDAGCGEGYYLNALVDFLRQKTNANDTPNKVSFVGLDISKDAIIQSAKRNKQISWVVGSNRQPPILAESIDIILCMFGFLNSEGFNKILKPGGTIILVDPGPEHLKELRKIIYPEVNKTEPTDAAPADIAGFTLLQSETIQFKEKIDSNEHINHLLVMTPHFYRASKQGREVACNLKELEITIDVIFKVLGKATS